jgi:hypothetical protein
VSGLAKEVEQLREHQEPHAEEKAPEHNAHLPNHAKITQDEEAPAEEEAEPEAEEEAPAEEGEEAEGEGEEGEEPAEEEEEPAEDGEEPEAEEEEADELDEPEEEHEPVADEPAAYDGDNARNDIPPEKVGMTAPEGEEEQEAAKCTARRVPWRKRISVKAYEDIGSAVTLSSAKNENWENVALGSPFGFVEDKVDRADDDFFV